MDEETYPIEIGDRIYDALLTCVELSAESHALTAQQRALLAFVQTHPDVATAVVANMFGVIQSTMRTRLERLARLGLLRVRRAPGVGGTHSHWTAI